MTAYLIADLDVHDAEKAAEYRRRVEPLVAKHGGQYLVRGGQSETMEGAWQPGRLVVIEFPDMGAARAFYEDPEYQPVLALRQASSTGSLIIVDGLAD